MIITAPWLNGYFPFDSYIPGSSHVERNFIFQKISWPKGHWNVPAFQSTMVSRTTGQILNKFGM